MARRIPKHATGILPISDAGTKHVDTYPTGGLAYNPLSMTNVSNALIRKIKDEDVHGTSYRDEARHLFEQVLAARPLHFGALEGFVGGVAGRLGRGAQRLHLRERVGGQRGRSLPAALPEGVTSWTQALLLAEVIERANKGQPIAAGYTHSAFVNSTGGLRGFKRSYYEGGVRSPSLVRWPGVVEPGSVSTHPWAGSACMSEQ